MSQRFTIASLAHPIALALDEVWQPQEGFHGIEHLDHAATLTHADGRQIHLSERWDDPGYLHARGAFPVSDYPFRRGDRDSIRIAMDEGPEAIARAISDDLIPNHREVHARVTKHNQEVAQIRRDVEELARDFAARLPGARTRIDGSSAYVALRLETGDVGIVIDSHAVSVMLNDAPKAIADAAVFAVSRFLPHVQTSDDERGQPVQCIDY
ncbi:hypothetical protein [Streptomyces chrestomyceticus]|uniref:hypothetical protein n=1 Tax=Streptomyces chrestomyceticus TaxID=68185 RepID=UPI0033DDE5AB